MKDTVELRAVIKKKKKRKPEVEHMLKLHEKTSFGPKINREKITCWKKETVKISLEGTVRL